MSQNPISRQYVKTHNCCYCHYNCSKLSDLNKHLLTAKHKKKLEEINMNQKNPQKSPNYNCSHCNFVTKKLSAFNKHIITVKHKHNINFINAFENDIKYNCNYCDKKYNKKNSCIKHQQICMSKNSIKETVVTSNNEITCNNDIINRLILENQELRNFMTEQNKEFMKTITDLTKNNHIINNNTINGNVNNNKFNINLFLNEKCKDAMNFSEFIENIEVSHEDLENNAQLGFVNGISKIIIDNLKQLSIYDRPIHCSDVKRETMYIKDENKWEKEEDTKKLKNAIQEVSRKSMISLVEWQDTNPDFQDMDSEFSNKCITMTQQCIAGSNRDVYYPKVIRSLAKETMIEKNM
jgi:hypothetical protein